MPKHCASAGCRGNYRGEPYCVPVVKFPRDQEERQRWIDAMPNDPETLKNRKDIYICSSHFDCDWVKIRGGKYPSEPLSVFPGVPSSCLKQTSSTPRQTQSATADARSELDQERKEANDMITDYDSFILNIKYHVEKFTFIQNNDDFTMFMTDSMGKRVVQYLHLRNVSSPFGFLKIICAEKDGFEVKRNKLGSNRDGIVHRWSELKRILNVLNEHCVTSADHLQRAIEELDLCEDLLNCPSFQFIQDQLQLLSKPNNNKCYSKHIIIFALELIGVSPAAYKLIRNSKAIILPGKTLIDSLLSNTFKDINLSTIFKELQPKQRMVNILLDEVKLKKAVRFSGGHILGYAENNPDELATSALVIELVCNHGGPKYIFRIYPTSRLNADQLKGMLLEAASAVVHCGGRPFTFVCDNCAVNQKTYKDLGGPGYVDLQPIGISVFLIYDYVHIFKNIRNNWITEPSKELSFSINDKQYVASWNDVITLYETDRTQAVRLTKLTHVSVFPKPLQRQSVPYVCQIFNEKTPTALKSLSDKFTFQEGTQLFINLISNWFKMMNVKNNSCWVCLSDAYRKPWELNCESFTKLNSICQVISSCRWSGGKGRVKKLTQSTADAFTVSTTNAITAAQYLMNNHGFQYVLPAVFSQDPAEIFFGQARQRSGGNFYIDIVDVRAAGKVQQMHQLVKHDAIPESRRKTDASCTICEKDLLQEDIDIIQELDIAETQNLLESSDIMKHKVVFIAGYLVHKHGELNVYEDEEVPCEFISELSRGGLKVPTLTTVYFVHNAINLHNKMELNRKSCRKYFQKLLFFVDAPMAINDKACKSLTNILFKAYALDIGDTEKKKGCLRRKEKKSD